MSPASPSARPGERGGAPERGLVFTGPNVLAIMRGRKTQTRRVLSDELQAAFNRAGDAILRRAPRQRGIGWDEVKTLWVKEALHRAPHAFTYAADGVEVPWPARQHVNGLVREKISPIFMPRAVSRLSLAVTDVRVQRLDWISEDDAQAEGVRPVPGQPDPPGAHRIAYRDLWLEIHGKGSWERNPWVAAITFERAP